MFRLALATVLAFNLTGCGLYIFKVSVQPSSLAIPQGLSNSATVTLERSDTFKDRVKCELIQASGAALPAGIGVVFDPATFEGTATSARMTLTIADTAAATAKPITARVECAAGNLYNFADFTLEIKAKSK
jgi:hypothetical protein